MAIYGGPDIVTDGLVLHLDAANSKSYPGSGTSWFDLSGNNNNGTLTNGPTYSSANRGSIVFDGINDYIIRETLSSFSVGSISLWVRPQTTINSSSGFQSLIQLRYQAAAGNFAWLIALGAATSLINNEYITILNVQNNTRTGVVDNGSLLANTWYNLVFNFETSLYRIYVNNVIRSTVSATAGHVGLLTNPNRLYLSALDGDGSPISGFFQGSIGQTLLYNRSLSVNEILQNYNALKGRYGL